MDELNILIVDNELLTRDLLTNHLKHLGLKVFAVESGKGAGKLIPQEAFRLAIVNSRFGDKAVKEIIDQLHKFEIDALVFLISAQSTDAESLSRLGAFDTFVKPFRLEDVSLKIGHARELVTLRRAIRSSAEKIHRLEQELTRFQNVEEQVKIPDLTAIEVDTGRPEKVPASEKEVGGGETEAARAASGDAVGLIRQLDALRKAGILSEAEFNSKKKELLKRI